MKRKMVLFLASLFTLLTVGCATKPVADTSLTIALATSLTDVSADLADAYQTLHPEIALHFTYGSSGELQLQIENGAPIDLFISAAPNQIKALSDEGLILSNTIVTLLSNRLVLIVPKKSKLAISSFEDCQLPSVKTIALGEPKSVPLGHYTAEVFESLELSDRISGKAHYATNARQVLTWVESGVVDCGIVYQTDALSSDAITPIAEAPENSHDPIAYDAAILSRCENLVATQDFLDFLSTKDAQAIFLKHGFKLP